MSSFLFGSSILFFLDLISWFLFLVKSCLLNDLNIFLFDLLERTILSGLSSFKFLSRERNYGVIAGTVPAPDSEKEEEKWEVKDAQIMSCILGSMEHSMLLNLKPYKSSREMWDYLKKVYNQSNTAQRFQLELELGQLSQCSMSIQEFYSSFVNFWA